MGSYCEINPSYDTGLHGKIRQMNECVCMSVVLLFFASGCGESVPSRDAATTSTTAASGNAPDRHVSGREHSVVKLTDAAAAKFKEFLADEPTKHIRLSVKGGGLTGFQYDLQIDDSIDEADFVDSSHGFVFIVDPRSSIFLDGATIDWQTLADGRAGFQFDNPNAVQQ